MHRTQRIVTVPAEVPEAVALATVELILVVSETHRPYRHLKETAVVLVRLQLLRRGTRGEEVARAE